MSNGHSHLAGVERQSHLAGVEIQSHEVKGQRKKSRSRMATVERQSHLAGVERQSHEVEGQIHEVIWPLQISRPMTFRLIHSPLFFIFIFACQYSEVENQGHVHSINAERCLSVASDCRRKVLRIAFDVRSIVAWMSSAPLARMSAWMSSAPVPGAFDVRSILASISSPLFYFLSSSRHLFYTDILMMSCLLVLPLSR